MSFYSCKNVCIVEYPENFIICTAHHTPNTQSTICNGYSFAEWLRQGVSSTNGIVCRTLVLKSRRYNIRTVFRSDTTLRRTLTKVRPPTPKEHTKNCIYDIPPAVADRTKERHAAPYWSDWKNTERRPSEVKLWGLAWQSMHGPKETTDQHGTKLQSPTESHIGKWGRSRWQHTWHWLTTPSASRAYTLARYGYQFWEKWKNPKNIRGTNSRNY